MNKLKISLKEDGSILHFAPDFKIMRGSYRNVLINIEVPRSLLLESAKDDNGEQMTGNNIRIAGIIHTVTGKNVCTKRYELKWVKDYTFNGIEYSLYQRKMPKEFTLWETNDPEESSRGAQLDMAINVVNWAIQESGAKVEEIASSNSVPLAVHPGAFLENAEEIEDPNDFDLLMSQVQNIDRDFSEFKEEYQNWINSWYLQERAEYQQMKASLESQFAEMKADLEEQFDEEFKDLNRRMNYVERDSLIRIDGEKISESDLMVLVDGKADGLYIANTEQFDDEIILISRNNELIARYTATGASYYLDREINDWVMSAGGGGGGGGGSGSTVRLTAMSGLQITTAVGSETILVYNFKSNVAGKGTAKYYVNDTLKETKVVSQGNVSFDATNYIASGTTNIKVQVTDTAGTSAMLEYIIDGVELKLSSPFNDALAYTGDVEFRYTVSGEVEKTLYFTIDGATQDPVVINSTRQQTFMIPALSHGIHTFSVYAEAEINGLPLTSNELSFKIIAYEEENNDIIISSKFEQTESVEGDIVAIDYIVYNPANSVSTVDLKINNEVVQTLSVNRTKQYWYVRNLAVGENTLTIQCGEKTLSFTIQVAESDFNLSAVEENLELYLSAYGKNNSSQDRENWSFGDYSAQFSNFNWSTNGWLNNALRLNGAAQVYIPFKVFEKDFRTYGKTIEFEFAARDVATIDTMAIISFADNKGIKLKMNEASIQSEQSSVNTKYKDEEKIRVSFVVDSKDGLRLIKTYVNGVVSGITQYPANDNFQQSSPVGITINPEGGSVDIYNIRIYDTALSDVDMLNNYMADLETLTEQVEEYNKNNIFDTNGEVSYSKVKGKIATVVITGKLPTVKGDKKTAKVSYENPLNIARNFEKTATIDVQGTSSQYYPRKNWKIKLPEAIDFFGNGLREQTYTIKVNYMESGNRNNTGIANFIHGENGQIYSEKVPPQETNEAIRTVIKGEPVVLFHKATETSTPKFYAIGQFNNDKGNADTLGLNATYPNAESWEFKDNDELLCLFRTNDFSRNANAFEARYPDGNTDYTQIDALVDWVYSTKDDITRFKNEFEQHFNLHYTLMYYIITEAFGMIDSRAKNMFLSTWDGTIWYPVLYDMDTAFGLNNEGVNNFGYNIEYGDSIGSQNVYNGSSSVLWNNFEEAFADEIKALYQSLRSDEKMSSEVVISALDEVTSAFSKALYNIDAENKYIGPLQENGDATYLYCAQGDRREHLKWWLDKRFKYLDSKYYASEYADDYISMRIYSPSDATTTTVVPFNGAFTLKSFIALYMGVRYGGSGELFQVRANAETDTVVQATTSVDLNDKETYIYGASKIKDLGDISCKYPGTVDVSRATQLTRLIVGNANVNYSNTNLIELKVGNNKLLNYLDIRNCPNLTEALDLSGCENIKTVYAGGTGLVSVTLAEGGNLETLQLPDTITNLTLKNQPLLKNLSLAGMSNISTLVVENCHDSVYDIVTTIIRTSNNLQRLRLINVNWSLENKSLLYDLMSCGGIDENNNNIDKAIITGTVHIPTIGQTDIDEINAYFPDLTITYDNLAEQFEVKFVNWDGTVLDTQWVDKGRPAQDPTTREANPIATPTRQRDEQYTYTFSGWDDTFSAIYASKTITAQYTTTTNTYTVNFYNSSSGTAVLLYTTTVEYGKAAAYVGDRPVYTGSSEGDFMFGGWSPSVSNITEDTNAFAVFSELSLPSSVIPLSECTPIQIKSIGAAGTKNASNQWVIGDDVWFEIGDETTINLTNGETLTLQIADFNHDVDASDATLPFTFVTKELMADSKQMNSTNTNSGGWSNSAMYTYLQETVWSYIPDEWKTVITPAKKKSTEGNQSTNILTSIDNLFLLARVEVSSTTSAGYVDEGTLYPIFTDSNSRIKYKVGATSASGWWLRSPGVGSSASFCYVSSGGSAFSNGAYYSYGVCFAFCI